MPEPNLRMLRYSRNLTQEELGKAIGVSQATITSWEQGKSKPSMEAMKKLTEFYKVDPSVIYYAVFYK